jgi:hypothetical protein
VERTPGRAEAGRYLKLMLEEMRSERNAWREQAQRLALPASKPVEKPMSWWRWLRRPA